MASPRLSQYHNLRREESDFIVECAVQYKETIVGLRLERTTAANTARLRVWQAVAQQFERRFGKKINDLSVKGNFKYRQKSLRNDKEKCRILEQWMDDPSCISEEELENCVGRVDYLLFKMHPQGVLTERNGEELEKTTETSEGMMGRPTDFPEMVGVIKNEEDAVSFDDTSQSHEPLHTMDRSRSLQIPSELPSSSSTSDSIPHKRRRLEERETTPRFDPPSSEKEHLELELLRAKIQLTKSKQVSVDKQIESNTAMIAVLDRLVTRLDTKREEKKEEPEQSAMMSLISIMKEMVKK